MEHIQTLTHQHQEEQTTFGETEREKAPPETGVESALGHCWPLWCDCRWWWKRVELYIVGSIGNPRGVPIEVYISQHKSATREEEDEPGDEGGTVSPSPSRQCRDLLAT